jgi:hypothetical protein
MRTLEKDTPKECIDAFLDAVKAPKAKSDRRIIVVDETLPPQLKKEIDEDLKREARERQSKSRGNKTRQSIAAG